MWHWTLKNSMKKFTTIVFTGFIIGNRQKMPPQKIEFLSAHLGSWDNIDFEDRRQVADIILSQIHATGERVSFEWKI